jgi:hypothetical protein
MGGLSYEKVSNRAEWPEPGCILPYKIGIKLGFNYQNIMLLFLQYIMGRWGQINGLGGL